MDPQKTLDLMLDAIREGELEEAEEHLRDLVSWTRNGGFAPDAKASLARLVELDRMAAGD